MLPYQIKLPEYQTSCVIFNSPHSGRHFPKGFLDMTILSSLSLRSSEDLFVDQIFSPIVHLGSILMSATFPRSYVDVNRDHKELDPLLVKDLKSFSRTSKVTAGLGVIPRVVAMQKPIYSKKISKKEVKDRLEKFYFPYHEKLREVLSYTHGLFQKAILLDCHSMPSNIEKNNGHKNLADVVLGDCFGSSCENSILFLLKRLFLDAGFKVDINMPFSGGFITKNYSNPEQNYHVIQIEFLRSLYSDEKNQTRCPKFSKFQHKVLSVFEEFIKCISNN